METLLEYLSRDNVKLGATFRSDSDIFKFNLAVILHKKSHAWDYDSIEICINCIQLDSVMSVIQDYEGIPFTGVGPWDSEEYMIQNKTIPLQEFLDGLKLRRSLKFLSISFPTKKSENGLRKKVFTWYDFDDIRNDGSEYIDMDNQIKKYPENFLFYEKASQQVLVTAINSLNKK